jgi:hypothetical protein
MGGLSLSQKTIAFPRYFWTSQSWAKVLIIDIKPCFSYYAIFAKRDSTGTMIQELQKKTYSAKKSMVKGRARDAME